jgi:tetratricopeptide (TPR) repeat protein
MKRSALGNLALFIMLTLIVSPSVFSQSSSTISISPSVSVPIEFGTRYVAIGGGALVRYEYTMPFFRPLSAVGEVSNMVNPTVSGSILNVTSVRAGLSLSIPFTWRFRASVGIRAGAYNGLILDSGDSGKLGLSFGGGLIFDALLHPSWGAGIFAQYTYNVGYVQEFNAGVRVVLKLGRTEPLKVESIEINQIFPVLYTWYDKNPIGAALIRNTSETPITDLDVTFFVEKYMDNPATSVAPDILEADGEVEIPINALFNDRVLQLSEGTKVSARIDMSYEYQGARRSQSIVETISINNRNAMLWDDDSKAAAFVTELDPAVLELSRNAFAWLRDEDLVKYNENLCKAIVIHEVLREYGMQYVIDPTSPYIEFSQDTGRVDYLQFPVQTLKYRLGDCDDLSILYCALLESVGIPTAFITVPGHIYAAVDLQIEPRQALADFANHTDLVILDDRVWLPIEVTEVSNPFTQAWQIGAEQWRTNIRANTAELIPVHNAWEKYAPVGYEFEPFDPMLPSKTAVLDGYSIAIGDLIETEFMPRIRDLEERAKSSAKPYRYLNGAAVLYARYGMYDEAMKTFNAIVSQIEYLPALINQGNIYFVYGEYTRALERYEQAQRIDADNAVVQLQITRTFNKVRRYEDASLAYERLHTLDPELAEKFSANFVNQSDSSRAAQSGVIEVIPWYEED